MTQERAVFYVLVQSQRINKEEYVPAWKFVGELEVKEIKEWFFMSYKCPANGINIFFKNPNLIERIEVVGQTGAKYFSYRINPNSTPDDIIDPKLKQFYKLIKK